MFKARQELLCHNFYEEFFLRYCEHSFNEVSNNAYSFSMVEKLLGNYSFLLFDALNNLKEKHSVKCDQEIWICYDLRFAESNFCQLGFLKSTRTTVILSILDFYWTEYIERMGYIRETINWRAYGQQNPLAEYNNEAFKLFKQMLEQIRSCMLYSFLNNPLNY